MTNTEKNITDIEAVKDLYRHSFNSEPTEIAPITGSGSNRRYFRLTGADSGRVIATVGTDLSENKAFIYLSNHFAGKGLPVPEVIAVSEDGMVYLQNDLGSDSLFALISPAAKSGNFSESEKTLLRKAMELLSSFHDNAPSGLDWSVCFPQKEFDERTVDWDLNYFKYCFLKPSGIEFSEIKLQDEFDALKSMLLSGKESFTFMIRDFQSRNVMVSNDGTLGLIDFQGGRKGPAEYDAASFLWQAKANIPQELRDELAEHYLLARYPRLSEGEKQRFRERLRLFALFRMLQVLGAYGFRGWMERKAHFLESIPAALKNASALLAAEKLAGRFPYLKSLIEEELVMQVKPNEPAEEGLTVRVTSFSFKKGIPEDPSGNGGGYVFDCRATHNPGRYAPYKSLTGMDKPVIDFLEKDGEILPFLDHALALVDASVERYIERGLSSLCVNFGCTGGQHRSVYSAERTAKHLSEKYGIRILLTHREQGVKKEYPATLKTDSKR